MGAFRSDLSRRICINNCFDQVRTIDQLRKLPREISQDQAFCNPFISLDLSFLQHFDDARELAGTVSACEKGDLPLVKERVVQRNRVARQAYEYECPSDRYSI